MRPYLAIIRDSFHAALSSRVLWIAFVAIWVVLASLAPIGYQEDLTAEFRGARDLENRSRLQALLAQDMYLAGAFVLLLSSLTVVGMLISDILLVLLDPRVKYD